jgi:8-oxo-dGTP pyrophosphatase MutT (NUDIX family)
VSGLHADALARLRGWRAPTSEQERLRAVYVGHLEARPDGLRRTCLPDHLTASTLVLDAGGERVLLTLHTRARRWFQLGGHLEVGDPTLDGAALREATEESGLTGLRLNPEPVHLDAHAVPFCGGPGTRHLDVRFLAVATGSDEVRLSAESADLAWWPVGDLPSSEPSLHELVRLGLARLHRA